MILLGKPVADIKYEKLKTRIDDLIESGSIPTLAIIQLCKDDSLDIYLQSRQRIASKLGVKIISYKLIDPKLEDVKRVIEHLNKRSEVWGIMVDNPLPANIKFEDVIPLIDPSKDVEGFNRHDKVIVPVARSLMEIIKAYKLKYKNENYTVVGDSKTVGQPIIDILRENEVNVTVFNDPNVSKNIEGKMNKYTVVATNEMRGFKAENFRKSSVVFDIGSHTDSEGYLCGDVDESVYRFVELLCPSPKGVGPLTSIILFENLINLRHGEL